jgi:uncharacterized membrane protein YdbT with pleckstrin-like domain
MNQIIPNEPYDYGKKSLWVSLFTSLFLPIFISIIAFIGSFFIVDIIEPSVVMLFGIGFAVIIAVLMLIKVTLQHQTTQLIISENALYLKAGIISRSEESIPFRFIHDISLHQSVFERLCGICELRIEMILEDNAMYAQNIGEQTKQSDFILSDLDLDFANALRETLMNHSNVEKFSVE